MRIIGKKRDFYDCIKVTDSEPHPVYVRNPEEVQCHRDSRIAWPFMRWDDRQLNVGAYGTHYIVGFCGCIYPMIQFRIHEGTATHDFNCYSAAQITDFVDNNLKKKVVEHYHSEDSKKPKYYFVNNRFTQRWFEQFFAEYAKIKHVDRLFVRIVPNSNPNESKVETKHSPIFLAECRNDYNTPGSIIYDADNLKDVGFQKVKDTFTAYQDLRMYLDNLAWPDKPIPKLSNSDLIESKGFDVKSSFRKEPTKKRK